ncbi:MAG TPA: EamA family transporter [Candidatus Limnocylindrales bacterium]|nr:EamA family transporter [Candidatus Limnocylindrales bacterium]
MSPLIVGLVAVAAVLHVAWNVRLKTAGDPLRTATIGMLAASIGIVPAGLVAWWVSGSPPLPAGGVALGIASGVVEAIYFVFLAAAYRRGDLSIVYPLARGTAPLLAVVVGVGLLGERLGLGGSLGVVALLVGFLWLQRPWRAVALARSHGSGSSGERAIDTSILFALATGVTIATYTAMDRVGTRLIEPVPYAAILWVTCCVALVLWIWLVAGGDLLRHGPAAIRSAVIGGWLTLGAYLCVLVALSAAPLSGVAPLRESATVLAAAWGAVKLGEATDRVELGRRVGASLLIVAGALLLAVGG